MGVEDPEFLLDRFPLLTCKYLPNNAKIVGTFFSLDPITYCHQYDSLCNGKVITIFVSKIMTESWKINMYLRLDSKGALLILPAESKLFLVVFITKNGEKEKELLGQSIAACQTSGYMFIYNESTCGTAAIIGDPS